MADISRNKHPVFSPIWWKLSIWTQMLVLLSPKKNQTKNFLPVVLSTFQILFISCWNYIQPFVCMNPGTGILLLKFSRFLFVCLFKLKMGMDRLWRKVLPSLLLNSANPWKRAWHSLEKDGSQCCKNFEKLRLEKLTHSKLTAWLFPASILAIHSRFLHSYYKSHFCISTTVSIIYLFS